MRDTLVRLLPSTDGVNQSVFHPPTAPGSAPHLLSQPFSHPELLLGGKRAVAEVVCCRLRQPKCASIRRRCTAHHPLSQHIISHRIAPGQQAGFCRSGLLQTASTRACFYRRCTVAVLLGSKRVVAEAVCVLPSTDHSLSQPISHTGSLLGIKRVSAGVA